jgi:Flp pilus assembly protein TadD
MSRLQRAKLLYHQDRPDQALTELRLQLLEDPEDFEAHAYTGLCLLAAKEFDAAQQHAQQAIHLAPEEPFSYYALAHIFDQRNRLPEAQRAIQEALRLDPYEPGYFSVLASIHLQQRRWKEALAAADEGLSIDPEHNVCLNLRAQALIKLGDRAGAATTIGDALSRRPDDPLTHANQGWALLERGNPKQAMIHFREALRLKPDLEFARVGIVEALKARNFIYRGLLAYFLWMAKLPRQVQWGLVIGFFFGNQALQQLAKANPTLAPYIWIVIGCYIAFALMTWIAYPLFNLLLRLDRFGRHALDEDQTRGANWLGLCLLGSVLSVVAYLTTRLGAFFVLAIILGLLSMPVSAIWRCDKGWPRTTMVVVTLLLLFCGLLASFPIDLLPRENLLSLLIALVSHASVDAFIYGSIGSQFLAGYLMSVRVRK